VLSSTPRKFKAHCRLPLLGALATRLRALSLPPAIFGLVGGLSRAGWAVQPGGPGDAHPPGSPPAHRMGGAGPHRQLLVLTGGFRRNRAGISWASTSLFFARGILFPRLRNNYHSRTLCALSTSTVWRSGALAAETPSRQLGACHPRLASDARDRAPRSWRRRLEGSQPLPPKLATAHTTPLRPRRDTTLTTHLASRRRCGARGRRPRRRQAPMLAWPQQGGLHLGLGHGELGVQEARAMHAIAEDQRQELGCG
jgi:hypothetical protein